MSEKQKPWAEIQRCLQSALAIRSTAADDEYATASQRVADATLHDLAEYLDELMAVISDHGVGCVGCGKPLAGMQLGEMCPECEGNQRDVEPRRYGDECYG